ncbi:hypothetical protein ACU610_15205 [Geodermatophilus sp. URMC 61]|uniref:hypothetical protein n=1 Tax=Geodermatophilus sp. URMC 61 TaxID=3423411 RepID=UPI00406C9C29
MNGFLVALIVVCEIGFWCLLGAGLVARYVLRLRRTSAVLLAGAPVLDLLLLIASVLDLRSGRTAGVAHGLAAAYIGFSVAFGSTTLRWADQRFAHRFAGGPPPERPPRYGQARTRHEWRLWARASVGWAMACGLLGLAIVAVDDPARTAHLTGWIQGLTAWLVVWALAWPLPYTLWPKTPPAASVDDVVTAGPGMNA